MKSRERLYIGTSGWIYRHWSGIFYPADLSTERWLNYYTGWLNTVEINNSFYQLPSRKIFQAWKESVPEGFIFSVKANRYITHMKKLKNVEQSVERFFNNVKALEEKCGPILFQLPPRWKRNPERLELFLDNLPENFKYAFEFRDSTWFDNEIYSILSRYNAAFCIYQFAGLLSPREVTADYVYIRLHGPEVVAYRGQYSKEELSEWAKAISLWLNEGREVYCYFDNDENAYAATDAIRLQEMIR